MNVFFSSGRAPLQEQRGSFNVVSIRFQSGIGLLKKDANPKSKEWNLYVPHLDSNKNAFSSFSIYLLTYLFIYLFIYVFIVLTRMVSYMLMMKNNFEDKIRISP